MDFDSSSSGSVTALIRALDTPGVAAEVVAGCLSETKKLLVGIEVHAKVHALVSLPLSVSLTKAVSCQVKNTNITSAAIETPYLHAL